MNSFSARGFIVICSSFILALIISILPLPNWINLIAPQWLLIVVIYWVLALPHRINLGIAWLLGLLQDGLYGSLLGEHALAMIVVAYLVDRFHRQIRMFPILQQAGSVFLLVLIYLFILIWIQGMLGSLTNDVYLFWASALTSMVVWPWLFITLRASRRRFRVH